LIKKKKKKEKETIKVYPRRIHLTMRRSVVHPTMRFSKNAIASTVGSSSHQRSEIGGSFL